MPDFLFPIFHENSKSFKNRPPLDANLWPASWNEKEFKTYARLPRVPLPSPSKRLDMELATALLKRKSRQSKGCASITPEILSDLLFWSLGLRGLEPGQGRMYPSAGARYPLEAYLLTAGGGFLKKGIYHYEAHEHSLATLPVLPGRERDFDSLGGLVGGMILVLTAVFDRSSRKYGDRSYRFTLLEAGHVAQNVYLVGEALGLSVAHRGLLLPDDRSVESVLDIDGFSESVIAYLSFGDRVHRGLDNADSEVKIKL